MLYDFHASQNAKRPHSVHATYLVSGVKKVGKAPADDVPMTSSPFPTSYRDQSDDQSATEIPIRTVTLVREEELEGMTGLERIRHFHG
jgi:DNA polymerase delta subunit 3